MSSFSSLGAPMASSTEYDTVDDALQSMEPTSSLEVAVRCRALRHPTSSVAQSPNAVAVLCVPTASLRRSAVDGALVYVPTAADPPAAAPADELAWAEVARTETRERDVAPAF